MPRSSAWPRVDTAFLCFNYGDSLAATLPLHNKTASRYQLVRLLRRRCIPLTVAVLDRRRLARTRVRCFACLRCDHTARVLPRLGPPTSSFPRSSGLTEYELMIFPFSISHGRRPCSRARSSFERREHAQSLNRDNGLPSIHVSSTSRFALLCRPKLALLSIKSRAQVCTIAFKGIYPAGSRARPGSLSP